MIFNSCCAEKMVKNFLIGSTSKKAMKLKHQMKCFKQDLKEWPTYKIKTKFHEFSVVASFWQDIEQNTKRLNKKEINMNLQSFDITL